VTAVRTGRRGIELDLNSAIGEGAGLDVPRTADHEVSGDTALLAAQVQPRLLGLRKIEAVAGDERNGFRAEGSI
jgi:hypothetical protein